jgi:2-keto-3-deoxy-L-rhamnonate aldolase RhmA
MAGGDHTGRTMPMPKLLSGRFKADLATGKTIGVIWLALGHAPIAEMAGRAGADAVVLDLQHGLWDRLSLEMAIGLSAVPAVARVRENSTAAIAEALDAGAEGVLVPMVETAAEAARAVAAARFPPHGHRSGGGVRPLSTGFADYMSRSDAITVGVMIETVAGVDDAEAIAAVPGLDYILIGTGDLGISYAARNGSADAVESACARVKAACDDAKLPCGIFTPGLREAAARRDEGYRLVVLANDVDTLRGAFAGAAAGFANGA